MVYPIYHTYVLTLNRYTYLSIYLYKWQGRLRWSLSYEHRRSSWAEKTWENSCNPLPLQGHCMGLWDGMGCGPGSVGPTARQGCGSWSPALLQHHWGRGWWPWGADTGPGQGGQGAGRGCYGPLVPSGPWQPWPKCWRYPSPTWRHVS